MKDEKNHLFTEQEYIEWLQLHKKRVIELRNEKNLKRKENLIGLDYPSYQLISDIESFRQGITHRSFFLDIRLLNVSAFKFYNTPYFKDESDIILLPGQD